MTTAPDVTRALDCELREDEGPLLLEASRRNTSPPNNGAVSLGQVVVA